MSQDFVTSRLQRLQRQDADLAAALKASGKDHCCNIDMAIEREMGKKLQFSTSTIPGVLGVRAKQKFNKG